MWKSIGLLTLLTCSLEYARSLDNGLAKTPPMGFLTWLRYACTVNCEQYPDDCLSDKLIRKTADDMHRLGFNESGYQYIIIDDCWPLKRRDPHTMELVPDPIRFPHGMKELGNYVRTKGFKFGIYLDYGTLTCGGYPGTIFYMEKDLNTLRSWGVEYIKMDGCYANQNQYEEGYEVFSKYINTTGSQIVFSCSYPAYYNWQRKYDVFDWDRLKTNCNLWRMYSDIVSSWSSIMSIINLYKEHGTILRKYAGPGSWNDPDMITIGNGGLSKNQEQVQMGMWAILAAPLMLSTDISSLTQDQISLLQNKALIKINQDALGIQGEMVTQHGKVSVWIRELSNEKYAIAFISENELGPPIYYTTTLEDIKISKNHTFTLKDVFNDSDFGTFSENDKISMQIPNTGIRMFLVS